MARVSVIAVAATDRNDHLASFSNYGPRTVDIAAPGVSIYSTLPGGRYGSYSGTSMAAPHVTGAIALVWDTHPSWTYLQVVNAILHSADSIPSLSGKTTYGRLDVAKAIAYGADAPAATPTPTPKDTTGAAVNKAVFSGTGTSINQVRLTFSEAINPSTFAASDVGLFAPNGRSIRIISVKAVAGSDDTEFDVTFVAQSAGGSYTLSVGPNIRDLAGNLMDQNNNGRNGEAADKFTTSTALSLTQTFASTDVGKAIPDLGQITSTLTVASNITIKDLNVQVNAAHSYDGDVRMTLIAPDGTKVILFNRRGGSGDNFNNTVFDDEGTNSIYRGTAPFSGTFKPEYVLSTFDGKSAKGAWRLVIEDTAAFDVGRLNAWSITIESATKAASASVGTAVSAASAPAAAVQPKILISAPPVDHDGRVCAGLASYFIRV